MYSTLYFKRFINVNWCKRCSWLLMYCKHGNVRPYLIFRLFRSHCQLANLIKNCRIQNSKQFLNKWEHLSHHYVWAKSRWVTQMTCLRTKEKPHSKNNPVYSIINVLKGNRILYIQYLKLQYRCINALATRRMACHIYRLSKQISPPPPKKSITITAKNWTALICVPRKT